jgi:hypothetical protein
MNNQTNGNALTTTDAADHFDRFLENEPPEVVEAKALARRYRLPYIDLLPPDQESPIDYEELPEIPVDLMLRNHFVPL